MFEGFFNYDNPVWRYMAKFGDLLLLNVLWIICSLPIVTIGASTTAVYYVTLKLARNDDGYTIKLFFKSFTENFKQSTIIWLILLVSGLLLGFDLYFFVRVMTGNPTLKTILTAATGSLTIIWLFVLTYAFPLQCRFYNPVKKTLFNALFMSIRHFFYTLGILALDVGLIGASYVSLFYAPQLVVLVILFGFPLMAFVNSYIFNRIFRQYIPEEPELVRDDEFRPVLDDGDFSLSPSGKEKQE